MTRVIEYSQLGTITFACDSSDDINTLPTTDDKKDFGMYAPMGSSAICGNEGGETEVYMLFSFGWKKL